MEIVVKDNVFVTNNIHVVDTGLYIQYEDVYFPSAKWTDFTFPILEEWKYNLLKMENQHNVNSLLYFHDGPFWLKIYKNSEMELKIKGINGRDGEKLELWL